MKKIVENDLELEYDVADVKGKLLMIKAPHYVLQHEYNEITKVADKLKRDLGIKRAIIMSEYMNYEFLEPKEAIDRLNDHIELLKGIKKKIEKEFGNGKRIKD